MGGDGCEMWCTDKPSICAYCDCGSADGGRGGESGGEGGRDGDVILTMAREGDVPRRIGSAGRAKEGRKRIGDGEVVHS